MQVKPFRIANAKPSGSLKELGNRKDAAAIAKANTAALQGTNVFNSGNSKTPKASAK